MTDCIEAVRPRHGCLAPGGQAVANVVCVLVFIVVIVGACRVVITIWKIGAGSGAYFYNARFSFVMLVMLVMLVTAVVLVLVVVVGSRDAPFSGIVFEEELWRLREELLVFRILVQRMYGGRVKM